MAIEDLCAEPPPSAPRALEIPFKTEFFFNRRWGIDEKGSRLERVQAEYELIPSVELAVEPQQVVLGKAEAADGWL